MFAVRSTSAVAASAVAVRRVGAKKFNPLAAHIARKAPVAKARFSVSANSGPPSADGSVDIYRDTPLRYMGYANEVGESFVAFLPVWGVPATYGVAGTYARLESMRAREFTRIRLFRQKKEKGSRGTPWCQPSPPDPRTETTQTDPPHPISRTIRSALYVLADTLDKGKKAYDGEEGACHVPRGQHPQALGTQAHGVMTRANTPGRAPHPASLARIYVCCVSGVHWQQHRWLLVFVRGAAAGRGDARQLDGARGCV